jgi:hypothetical protein
VAPKDEYWDRNGEQQIPNIVFPAENCEFKNAEYDQKTKA